MGNKHLAKAQGQSRSQIIFAKFAVFAGVHADVSLPHMPKCNPFVFKWTEQCENSFQELKDLLMSEQVMGYFDDYMWMKGLRV